MTALKSTGKEFILLIASLMSIVAISIDALLPTLTLITNDFRIQNPNYVQFVIGCFFIGMGFGELIAGPCSDAFGRKKVLYYGIVVYLAGSLVCLFSNSFEVLILGRIIQGLGVAAPYTTAVSIVRDKFSGTEMARVMSLVMMIFILVPAIAPSLGQAILFFAGWREVFILYIAYSLIITIWIYYRLEETLPVSERIALNIKNFKHGFIEVISNRTTRNYTICMGLLFGSFIGYLNSSQQIFQVQFATGKLFIVYFGILALVFGLSSFANSYFVSKMGMFNLCKYPAMIIISASALFLLLHAFIVINLFSFLLYATILFFCFGLIFGNLNAIAMEPLGHIAGMAAAIIGSVTSVISMIIGSVIGQLYDNSLVPITVGFLVSAIICLYIFYTTSAGAALSEQR